MNCPYCQHLNSQVIDTRPSLYNGIEGIRQRRQCSFCGKRFSSFEMSIRDLEKVEPITLDGILQQIITIFKEAPRTNYKALPSPLLDRNIKQDDINHKTPTAPLKTPSSVNGSTPKREDIKEAMRRARRKYAERLDELDASEFDDSDFDD